MCSCLCGCRLTSFWSCSDWRLAAPGGGWGVFYAGVMEDLSKLTVVVSMLTPDAMDSAKSLLELAELARNETQVSSAASAALVAAIAHLARAVDVALVNAVANREAMDGGNPSPHGIERQRPVGMPSKMRQLTREVLGADVELDDRRPGASVLKQAIRLRNKLIHHGGSFRLGARSRLARVWSRAMCCSRLKTRPSSGVR